MSLSDNPVLWPFVIMTVAAIATYAFRGAGVALGERLNTDHPAFEWVACVAYALLAGLIARMIVFPLGPVAETMLADRLGAVVIALAVFFLTRKNLALGVAAGAVALIVLSRGIF